jgi:hypothetical protein
MNRPFGLLLAGGRNSQANLSMIPKLRKRRRARLAGEDTLTVSRKGRTARWPQATQRRPAWARVGRTAEVTGAIRASAGQNRAEALPETNPGPPPRARAEP